MIEASVRQKGIVEFGLDCNQFLGGQGVQFAIDVLKNNRAIGTFGWLRNPIHSTEDAYKLVDAVLEHQTISTVGFIHTFNEGVIPYTPVKRLFGGLGNNALLKVVLSGNGIKTNGDRTIPDFLSANPPLQNLGLARNQLTDDDALHIALALQSNTNLRSLNLTNNPLTEKGKDAMYHQAIAGIACPGNSELTSTHIANLNIVSEANHTCNIDGISGSHNFMNDGNKSAMQNRRGKLFLFLKLRLQQGHIISELDKSFRRTAWGLCPMSWHAFTRTPQMVQSMNVCRFFSSWRESGKRQRFIDSTKPNSYMTCLYRYRMADKSGLK